MKALAACSLLLTLSASTAFASGFADGPLPPEPRTYAIYHSNLVQHGGTVRFAKAFQDSFNIYGGVRGDGSNDRLPEGQFETLALAPQDEGWFGVDRTETSVHWQVSDFNADNLDAGSPNHAMWCGVDGGTPGFASAPGYGNGWNDILEWRAPTNPTINTQVRLDFVYNHDSEPAYDFFYVEADSGGVWVPLFATDGDNRDGGGQFTAPVTFDETVLFTPLMYTGAPPFNVHLRLRFASDGAWSDEDGLWPTNGAVQVDNIRVRFNGSPVLTHGDGTATFESGDDEGWTPIASDFVGDFAKLVPQLRDIDACRTNITPRWSFVDDASPPNNAPQTSTGGQLSPNWSYGVPGGWVVNYSGGLTVGAIPLNNEVWSPPIAWDDPTSTEDDGLVGGAFMRFAVWQHLPLDNGLFWIWGVRSHVQGGDWSPWQNRNFVYFGDNKANTSVQVDVSDLLEVAPEEVQIALGAVDLADLFGSSGNDATPSPAFDSVSFWRYSVAGPAFSTRNIDLFNDSFAPSGAFDYDLDPAAMSVRLDMARDINSGSSFNIPGDSIVVDVKPIVPGTALAGNPVMKWILEANPLFDGVRSVPVTASTVGTTAAGWDKWMGTAVGDTSRVANGTPIEDRFFFDVPHDGPANPNASYQNSEPGMVFPGDRLRYFIEATDTGANITTLPGDTTGFMGGDGYARLFTVRALPGLRPDGPEVGSPPLLVINDFGHRGGENDFLHAFGQLGMVEGEDYEVYTVRGPSSNVSNGIGSAGAHGATGDQLSVYASLMYMSGNLSDGLISDGTNTDGNDKGDDVATLTAWHNEPGDRYMVHFGDNLPSFLNSASAGAQTYLNTIMGISVTDGDLRDEVGGTAAPSVVPTGTVPSVFNQDYVAFGGCLIINEFDSILPLPGAVVSHEFVDGASGFPPAAGVWHERTVSIDGTDYARVDLTFPYGFIYVNDRVVGKAPGGLSARTILLDEILQGFGHPPASGLPVNADPIQRLQLEVGSNHPNPFNPSTTIAFFAPSRGEVTAKVYNVRGELVRTLADGEFDAGDHELIWNGTDATGARVSSGIYLYRVQGFGRTVDGKMALVK